MNKKTITILIIILVVAIAGGFWFVNNGQNRVYTGQESKVQSQKQVEQQATNEKEQIAKQDNQIKEEDIEKQNIEELKLEEIDTSDWKEYCNEEYGFCLKYPRDWGYNRFANSYEKGIIFYDLVNKDDNDNMITINIAKAQESELRTTSAWAWTVDNLDQHIINNFDRTTDGECHTGIMQINFKLKEKVRSCLTTEGGGRMHRYFIKRNGNKYLLTINFPFIDDISNDANVYRAILESFKFINEK